MSEVHEIRTLTAYGYRLGGPRAWNLHKFGAGDELRTAWYDETNPTHDFAAHAMAATRAHLSQRPDRDDSVDLPFVFVEALEVSPPGWSPETNAAPTVSHGLHATSELLSLDRVAVAQHVLVISDSLFDLDAENLAHHRGDIAALNPAIFPAGDRDFDWDRVLIDTLTGLGLEPVGMPDWLWFRHSWSDDD